MRALGESGFGLLENLASISLVAIAVVGTIPLYVACLHANGATRTYAAVEADVQAIIEDYRNTQYLSVLAKFEKSPNSIADGESIVGLTSSPLSRADYDTTLVAMRSPAAPFPEAVRLQVDVRHRRGQLGTATYRFETVISQVR